MLQINHLYKNYGKFQAVNDLNLHIEISGKEKSSDYWDRMVLEKQQPSVWSAG